MLMLLGWPVRVKLSGIVWAAALTGLTCLPALAQDIPAGFKIERYTQLWERNPFAPETETHPVVRSSLLDGLFLSSWLSEDRSYTVLVQSLKTNEVMTITAAPNQNNLRLVRLNLNSDPRLVEAVISDGKELRAIKFHFDGQTPTDLGNSGAGQLSGAGNTRESVVSPSANLQNPEALGAVENSPGSQGQPYRIYPGLARVHHEGNILPLPTPARRELPKGKMVSRMAPDHSATESQ